MKIGEIVNYRGVSGEIIGKTTSLFQERKKVYFVRLENGKVVEPYEEDLIAKHIMCGTCVHYIPKKNYGRCEMKRKSTFRSQSVLFGDTPCMIYKPKK